MKSYIGVDVGSSGCKVTVIDESGVVLAQSSEPTITTHPAPGWVEQAPEEWLRAARAALRDALSGLTPAQVDATTSIAFSGPTHVAVLLDAGDRPLRNAIMWNDQRSGEQARRLEEEHGDLLREISHNSVSPTWTISHLRWLHDNEPELFGRVARITFLKDWVRDRFTTAGEEHLTDLIDAQGTMLVDITRESWSAAALALCELTAAQLPRIVDPGHRSGTVDPVVAHEFGLPVATAVITGTTDTATELLATGITTGGASAIKLATAGNVARVTDRLPAPSRDIVYSFVLPGTYYANSATSSAAASMRWLSRVLGARSTLSYEELDALAEATRPGADGLVFTPYLNGERSPHWDPDLRGALVGLTDRTEPGHIARAVMEGVAFSLKDAVTAAGAALSAPVVLIGGGVRSRVWPQIIADVLGVPLQIAPEGDSSAGAALLAARQHDPGVVLQSTRARSKVTPDPAATTVYDRLFPVYRAIAAATRGPSHDLKEATAP